MLATSQRLLEAYGEEISVSRTSGTYNSATGAVDAPSTTTYEGVGYPSNYRQEDIDGNLIRQDDTLLIFRCDTAPRVNDVFTVGTKAMTAQSIQIITVSGTSIIYKIQLRQ
jgi:hypothetical protein